MAYECVDIVGRANYIAYSWGANSYGQLAQGNNDDLLLPREIIPFNISDLKIITGGGGHSLTISESGKLYVCGSNSKGQLGIGTKEDVKTWTEVQYWKGKFVTKAVGGWDFTLILTNDGAVYTSGSNAFQQLGCPGVQNYTEIPVMVELPGNDIHVIDIAAGLRHSVVATEKGQVYTWGAGRKGQIGVVKNDTVINKSVIPLIVSEIPVEEKVVQVEAGSHHTLALTDQGSILAWGCNKYGQITLEPSGSKQINSPYIISKEYFDGAVIKIKCGWTHNIVQTVKGTVYSWGRADYGQLGRPCEQTYDHIPKPITGLPFIKTFACGSEHNLAVSDTGQLFTWGWNEHGMCGTVDELNVASPRVVTIGQGKVSHIGCGAGHSFALCHTS